jgi:hypothetical protein
MAQAPTPHHDPAPPAPPKGTTVLPLATPAKGDEKPRPIIGVRGEEIDDGERDPDTIAEEQRRRSDEMQKVGVDAYMKAHSTPIAEEDKFKKVVPGVTSLEHKAPPPPPSKR